MCAQLHVTVQAGEWSSYEICYYWDLETNDKELQRLYM